MVNAWRPETLAEALEILRREGATPYAGGTDLMVNPDPEARYLFIGHLPALHGVSRQGDTLRVGAASTFDEVLQSPDTPEILRDMIARIAAPAIRNLGTVGGNIANASPKADSALIFSVLDAKVLLQSASGERLVPLSEFYAGRNRTVLEPDELLVQIVVPGGLDDPYVVHKVGARASLSIARLSFAGVYRKSGARIERLATAFGAVTDVIVRRPDLDEMLLGKTCEAARAQKAAYLDAYDQAITPIRGRVSAVYRKRAMLNLLGDFIDTVTR